MSFFSQALASTINPCTHVMMDTAMKNHTQSHANMMMKDSETDFTSKVLMDCCLEECKCSMSGCFSPSLLTDTSFNTEVILTQKIVQLMSIHQSQVDTSLYRPPIS